MVDPVDPVESVVVGSVVDATERLFVEFEGAVALSVIVSVVRQCCRELQGAPVGALPELVERLSRQRLVGLGVDAAVSSPAGQVAHPA